MPEDGAGDDSRESQDGLVYIDIAGLNDSRGELVDLTNCFLDKYIFSRAKSLKFILAITYSQLTQSRNVGMQRVFEQLRMMSAAEEGAEGEGAGLY